MLNDLKNIFYQYIVNKKSSKTIFFIHGITGSSSAWKKYVNYFYSLGYSVIIMDLRGHGLSQKSRKKNYYNIENMANDVKLILEKENIKNPIFITHSFGTFILLEFIKQNPKINIEKIVFISPYYMLPSNSITRFFISTLSAFFRYFPLIRKIGKQIDYTKKLINTTDFSPKRIVFESFNTGFREILGCFNSIKNKNYFSVLKVINSKVLIIHGKEDKLSLLQNAYIFNRKIKGSKLLIYSKLDHIIVLNNFEEIIEDMVEFIEE